MPKDYQEIERIVKLLEEQYIEKFKKDWGFPLTDEQAEEKNWWVGNIKTTLTTYGNARELEGVEKCIKLSDEIELREPDGGTKQWMAFKAFRNTMRVRVKNKLV
jgi:hypothetical protein